MSYQKRETIFSAQLILKRYLKKLNIYYLIYAIVSYNSRTFPDTGVKINKWLIQTKKPGNRLIHSALAIYWVINKLLQSCRERISFDKWSLGNWLSIWKIINKDLPHNAYQMNFIYCKKKRKQQNYRKKVSKYLFICYHSRDSFPKLKTMEENIKRNIDIFGHTINITMH